ncbi:hypothetical protein FO519_003924 [Halicephalobus sp. NKZ332]|nr:hypothetical protein FO519_003924 [Halicephalobus sp. NKZ332]
MTRSTSLESLPNEIIYSIFNNVSSRQLWTEVRLLDKRLYSFIVSREYWLRRFKDKHDIIVRPEIKRNKELRELLRINIEVEEIKSRFDENDCLTDYLSCTGHIGTPDAFHTRRINNRRILFTGARDHKVAIWDLQNAVENKNLQKGIKAQIHEAHSGWIWDINSSDQYNFYTSSWDGSVKLWRYGSSAVMEDRFKSEQAFLKLACFNSCVAASNYSGKVSILDFKTSEKKVAEIDTKNFQITNKKKSPAIEVHYDNQHGGLIVGSENGHIYVFDPRNLSQPKFTKKIENLRTLTFNAGQLAACSSKKCFLLDPSNLNIELDFSQETNTVPFKCIPTYGGYFCADSFDIKIFTAGLNPRKITQATFSHRINNLMYGVGSDLIAGLGEGSIQLWPRDQIFLGRVNDMNDL